MSKKAKNSSKELRPKVVNPQVNVAPGEEGLEQAAEKAGPIASVQRHELL